MRRRYAHVRYQGQRTVTFRCPKTDHGAGEAAKDTMPPRRMIVHRGITCRTHRHDRMVVHRRPASMRHQHGQGQHRSQRKPASGGDRGKEGAGEDHENEIVRALLPDKSHVRVASGSVFVQVVQVGVMGMGMARWFVAVPVRMRLGHRPLVQVLVLGVMDMGVLMLQRFILMVGMLFSQVKSQADTHWYAGQTKLHAGMFALKPNCDHRPDEAGEREIHPGPNRSQITQRQHEQHNAYANAEEPD